MGMTGNSTSLFGRALSVVLRSIVLAMVAVLFVCVPAYAAQQLVATKTLLVKNPPSGARKVVWKAKETGSTATVIGDPTVDGAMLALVLTPGGSQCVSMPASGWSAIGTVGFKYKDSPLANGPVKVALIKKTPSGTFLLKALLTAVQPPSRSRRATPPRATPRPSRSVRETSTAGAPPRRRRTRTMPRRSKSPMTGHLPAAPLAATSLQPRA